MLSRGRKKRHRANLRLKIKNLPGNAIASSLEVQSACALKVDYGLSPRTARKKNQQKMATKEDEQWVRSELENAKLREKLDILEKAA